MGLLKQFAFQRSGKDDIYLLFKDWPIEGPTPFRGGGMYKLLVVDDSTLERELTAWILSEKDEYQVLFASNGAEAIQLLQEQDVDLLLTDLSMPEISGLDLLETVKRHHARTPVVIMTARGSEQIAVQALKNGAAGYVPKQFLRRDLKEIVESVLSIAGEERVRDDLLACRTAISLTLSIPNSRSMIPETVRLLFSSCRDFHQFEANDEIRVSVALQEALVNAIVHGNLEVSSELRELPDDSFEQLIELRRHQKPYCNRRVIVKLTVTREFAEFAIQDEGPGFDPAQVADPTDIENMDKASGRGLLLIRSFMDDVSHNDIGNCVRMVKRFQSAEQGAHQHAPRESGSLAKSP